VEDMRSIMQELRTKYKGALAEIDDLHHEHETNKEDLLDTIRQ